MTPAFWEGKRVFLTGHTGFKGAWLALWLADMGARVTGYALEPPSQPSLFEVAGVGPLLAADVRADLRDQDALQAAMRRCEPDIVLHLAAQSLVRESYVRPVETYAVNVLGTAHVLEAVRQMPGVRVAVIATSDKCYENREIAHPYREDEPMGGHDPYSSSKGAAELVTAAYARSFFDGALSRCTIASVRAGNVIGGGDWAKDRLMVDLMRGLMAAEPIAIRRPHAVRPWQHVLDPLSGYLTVAERAFSMNPPKWEGWNFGPDSASERRVEDVAALTCRLWGRTDLLHIKQDPDAPHEATMLMLDSGKARDRLGWRPRWPLEEAVGRTVDWFKRYAAGADMRAFTREQIAAFTGAAGERNRPKQSGNAVHA